MSESPSTSEESLGVPTQSSETNFQEVSSALTRVLRNKKKPSKATVTISDISKTETFSHRTKAPKKSGNNRQLANAMITQRPHSHPLSAQHLLALPSTSHEMEVEERHDDRAASEGFIKSELRSMMQTLRSQFVTKDEMAQMKNEMATLHSLVTDLKTKVGLVIESEIYKETVEKAISKKDHLPKFHRRP